MGNSRIETKNDLLLGLNNEQLKAVTHRAGPLLVVAGAGTGKTKTLTHRIAWLIKEGLAEPSQILALTFTEKAAAEMEARVDQLLPYGQTDTAIATFHSFGDGLLREYALDLGLPPEFAVLGQNEQLLFLSDRYDQIDDLAELRPVGNPRKYIKSILNVISRAKDELVTPEQYKAVAQKLISQAAGDEDLTRAALRQLDLAKIYAAYEDFKADKGVIDFGDQILKLVRLLDSNSRIKTKLQEQFRYILVDEFQDTNIAQYQLVKRLLSANNNLTVVGDDDQAIYKFRGAAISNILGFLKDFPTAERVVLSDNYRSSQQILDTAYRLICHNNPDRLESRLKINKKLTGQTKGSFPRFYWYEHEADELAELTKKIKSKAKQQPLNEIAILVRSNNLVSTITSSLTTADIPFSTSRDQSFENLPEVRGIASFLKCLAYTDDSLAHLKLALSPFYELKPEWILPFNDASRRSKQSVHDVLHNENSVAWERLDKDGKKPLLEFRDSLSRYRNLISSHNAGEILFQFLKDRGILKLDRDNSPQPKLFVSIPEENRLQMIQNIAAVFEAIKGYLDAGRDPFALTFVDSLDELMSSIIPPSVSLGPDVDAVQVMTVHASKGLEFEIIFLPSFMQSRFPARRRNEVLDLPEELIAEELPTSDEHIAEERRLAYVAITRAKKELILSGSKFVGTSSRANRISQFVLEALNISAPPPALSVTSPASRLSSFAPSKPVKTSIELPSYDGVYFLSPAAIETYQQDPYQFYWRYVLKAPQEPSRHLVYGNAIHSAIEVYYRLRKDGIDPKIDQILQRYNEAWVDEGFESSADRNRRFSHGEETLKRFVERAKHQAVPEFVEYSFKLGLPGIRISGRMDAVFLSQAEIRDFKTSQVKNQADATKKAMTNLPIKIYALAYKQKFGKLPEKIILDFVEHDLVGEIKPSNEMLESTTKIITDVVAGIRDGRFEPNPHNRFKDYE